MKKVSRMLILASALTLAGAPCVQSQPVGRVEEKRDYTAIRLEHVPPSLMKLMLVPRQAPQVLYTREEMEAVLRKDTTQAQIDAILNKGAHDATVRAGGGGKATSAAFALPEGVESIIPIDAQRSLLVFGTAEGAQRVREIVKVLDLPQRQVELEVLSVRIQKASLKEFGSDWAAAVQGLWLSFVPRGNYLTAIQKLLEANLANTRREGRATMTNNFGGSLMLSSKGDLPGTMPTAQLELTPTINNDETITVAMRSTAQAQEGGNGLVAINVRDGDTAAIAVPDAVPESQQITVNFITPRIVRRVEEKK